MVQVRVTKTEFNENCRVLSLPELNYPFNPLRTGPEIFRTWVYRECMLYQNQFVLNGLSNIYRAEPTDNQSDRFESALCADGCSHYRYRIRYFPAEISILTLLLAGQLRFIHMDNPCKCRKTQFQRYMYAEIVLRSIQTVRMNISFISDLFKQGSSFSIEYCSTKRPCIQ